MAFNWFFRGEMPTKTIAQMLLLASTCVRKPWAELFWPLRAKDWKHPSFGSVSVPSLSSAAGIISDLDRYVPDEGCATARPVPIKRSTNHHVRLHRNEYERRRH